MKYSRRKVLAGLGGLVAGGLVSNTVQQSALAASATKMNRFEQIGGDFSWKPQVLDLDEVARVAHQGFHHKGYG